MRYRHERRTVSDSNQPRLPGMEEKRESSYSHIAPDDPIRRDPEALDRFLAWEAGKIVLSKNERPSVLKSDFRDWDPDWQLVAEMKGINPTSARQSEGLRKLNASLGKTRRDRSNRRRYRLYQNGKPGEGRGR